MLTYGPFSLPTGILRILRLPGLPAHEKPQGRRHLFELNPLHPAGGSKEKKPPALMCLPQTLFPPYTTVFLFLYPYLEMNVVYNCVWACFVGFGSPGGGSWFFLI